jgi:hypothetical protein
MDAATKAVVQWFAGVGQRYVAGYVSKFDVERLKSDPKYGMECFLFHWAHERAGVRRGYRIAAIKTVRSLWPDISGVARKYEHFYHDKRNEMNNPCADDRLADLSIPSVVDSVIRGDISSAYDQISVRGVDRKIKSFFLRDLVTLIDSEAKIKSDWDYAHCQPIDVWLRATLDSLGLVEPPLAWGLYGWRHELLAVVNARLAGVSPLCFNQGVWYFCANAVADLGRLKTLLQANDAAVLDNELALMEGFLP